jgi:hypothetical protein
VLNQKQLADALGVTGRTVRNWVKDGCPTEPGGMYLEGKVRRWLSSKGREQPEKRAAKQVVAPIEKAAAAGLGDAGDAGEKEDDELPPPPTMDEERQLGVEARARLWMSAAQSARDLQRQLQSGELEPTPSHVEAIARAAKALSEAVRGDASQTAPPTLREALTEALMEYLAMYGREAYDAMLHAVDAIEAP